VSITTAYLLLDGHIELRINESKTRLALDVFEENSENYARVSFSKETLTDLIAKLRELHSKLLDEDSNGV